MDSMNDNPFYATPETIGTLARSWIKHINQFTWKRENLIPDPERAALLVIDMLSYFIRPDGRSYLPSSKAIVPAIRNLLDEWHRRDGHVIYTRHCHRGRYDLGMLGKFWSDHLRCGEEQSEIIAELAPQKKDIVQTKTTYDAFYGTDLEDYLLEHELDQVVITGVLTQMCCETTARSAFVRGFEVYVIADGTATTSELFHVNSLLSMASSIAVIMTAQDMVQQVREPKKTIVPDESDETNSPLYQ